MMSLILILIAIGILFILILDYRDNKDPELKKREPDEPDETEGSYLCNSCLYPLINRFFIYYCVKCDSIFIKTEEKMIELQNIKHDILIGVKDEEGGVGVERIQKNKSCD